MASQGAGRWARRDEERRATLDCGGRRGGPGRVAADWAGAGCAGPSGKERWAAGWAVVLERVLGWALFCLFLFLFYSYFKPNSNHLNSNSSLNSNLALKQKEQCTSMNATTNF